MKLGVNIDHIATLRQARYATMLDHPNAEPGILEAASACERAGADGITVHLRADRRHIQDHDVRRLRDSIVTKLNFEMGNSKEILAIALRLLPDDVCMVPENRQEITTEGGLNVVKHRKELKPSIQRLQTSGIRVSLFIDPDPDQVAAAAELGVEAVELHTGAFANALKHLQTFEFERLIEAAKLGVQSRLQVNAGHGINYENIALIRQINGLTELNIGHAIISRAVFIGLGHAVHDMLDAMNG